MEEGNEPRRARGKGSNGGQCKGAKGQKLCWNAIGDQVLKILTSQTGIFRGMANKRCWLGENEEAQNESCHPQQERGGLRTTTKKEVSGRGRWAVIGERKNNSCRRLLKNLANKNARNSRQKVYSLTCQVLDYEWKDARRKRREQEGLGTPAGGKFPWGPTKPWKAWP